MRRAQEEAMTDKNKAPRSNRGETGHQALCFASVPSEEYIAVPY